VNGRAVNVLYYSASDNASPPVAALYTAFSQIGEIIPSGTTISIPGSGDTINDTNGALVGNWSATPPATLVGGAAGNVAAGVGACVSWNTGGIVTGTKGPRRLRGRTFLVPLAAFAFEPNGTLGTVGLAKLTNYGTSMLASGPLAIWHRPTTPGATNGNSYGVQSYRIRDKVAVLRSRRD
jgi:hypothetical protein